MSDLVIDDMLTTSLSQQINSTGSNTVTAIRPHVFIEGSPAGTLRVDIYDEADSSLLASSNELTITDLKTDTYAHKYYRFDISYGLKEGIKYTIRLTGIGYTYSATDYVSWCRDFDLRKYTATYSPSEGFNSAYDMEVWTLNDNVRGL